MTYRDEMPGIVMTEGESEEKGCILRLALREPIPEPSVSRFPLCGITYLLLKTITDIGFRLHTF